MDQRDGSDPGQAIPVRSEEDILAWLKKIGGQAFAQTTHVYGERLYRGLQVIGRDGKRRRVWFDVTLLPNDQPAPPAAPGWLGSLLARLNP